MKIPIIKNVKDVSSYEISKLLSYGIAYVPISEEIIKKLELIEMAGDKYFLQPQTQKELYSFTADTGEGFLDQRKVGYDIERYIIRKLKHIDPFWNICSNEMLEVRNYFKYQIIEPLLSAIFVYLDIDMHKIQIKFNNADNTLSIIFYPECDNKQKQERIQPHQDTALMTILWSRDPGLEVEIDGKWHYELVKQDHIIVHLGNSLELMTNNQCHGVMHRVKVPENNTRLSIASFYALDPKEPFFNVVTNDPIANTFGEYATEHVRKTYSQK